MSSRLLICIVVLTSIITGCGQSSTGYNASYKKESKIMNITAQELMERKNKNDDLVLVDVRQPGELVGRFAALPDIINIPLPELTKRYQEIPKDKPIVMICHSGGRSAQACHFLVQQGYTQVFNLKGGMMAVK